MAKPRRFGLGASAECWDLHDKSAKAHRAAETAEYRFYERGIWPKNKTRAEMEEHIRKLHDRAKAIDAEFGRKGC